MKYFLSVLLIISLVAFAYADDIKIACLGNSITAYKGAYPTIHADSYPVQLRFLMPDGYDIRNFGVHSLTMLKNGDVSAWDEEAIWDGWAWAPDIVTIMFGTNDSKPQNWVYKDEFVDDYKAFIDTVRSFSPDADIYTCLPPPAFSSKYDINDSIIFNDIVPMIQQVAAEKNTKIIDFYSHFLDKEDLSYDGIHPVFDGLWEYARGIHTAITGDSIEVIQEVNLAAGKTVSSTNGIGAPENLVDTIFQTGWICESDASVTIDLGASGLIGMLQVVLYEPTPFGFTVETSEDNSSWTTAVSANNPETDQVVIAQIDPVNAQYVRFTFNPDGQAVRIAELRVLQEAEFYPPVITYTNVDHFSKSFVRYDINIKSCHEGGNIKWISAKTNFGIFEYGFGYRHVDDTTKTSVLLKTGEENHSVAKFYMDGIEVASDTMHIDFSITGINDNAPTRPEEFLLLQNYPNPFNPATNINYTLRSSGQVKLTVYDCLGKEIEVLVDGVQQAGDHSVSFHPAQLSSGVYLYSLEAEGITTIKKMLFMK